MSALLDNAGNINTARLSQELTSALDFDVKYKQVDNMKKRAVRTAGSYEEFKQLVAAAHLKKVSRKEVESLSDVRKGWKKSGPSSRESHLLDLRKANVEALTADSTAIKMKPARKPRTSMELDRNLRRMANDHERLSYLQGFQTRDLASLLKKAIDMDMLESIWRMHVLRGEERVTDKHLLNRVESLLNILEILESLPRWDLLRRLVPKSLVDETASMLQQTSLFPADGLSGEFVQRSQRLLSRLQEIEESNQSSAESSPGQGACESDNEDSSEDDDEDEDSSS